MHDDVFEESITKLLQNISYTNITEIFQVYVDSVIKWSMSFSILVESMKEDMIGLSTSCILTRGLDVLSCIHLTYYHLVFAYDKLNNDRFVPYYYATM